MKYRISDPADATWRTEAADLGTVRHLLDRLDLDYSDAEWSTVCYALTGYGRWEDDGIFVEVIK